MSNTVVNTNVLALNSHRSLKQVGNMQSKSSARLSSGMKINSGADDAAGLAISEKMRAQIKGLDMASKNSQDAISMIQTADGGLSEMGNMTQRIRELAVQAGNDTNVTGGANDTGKLAAEASQLLSEIDNMAKRTEFNKKKLLDNGLTGGYTQQAFTMQVGANSGQATVVKISTINTSTLGLSKMGATQTDTIAKHIAAGGASARAAIDKVQTAIDKIAKERASLGALQNRFEYTIKSLDIASENTSAAESRIRDTDMAKEMMNVSKASVLQQAATSMLSQANQAPQGVLSLLR